MLKFEVKARKFEVKARKFEVAIAKNKIRFNFVNSKINLSTFFLLSIISQ